MFFVDLLADVLHFFYQAFLALLECAELVTFLFNKGLGNLQIAKISDFTSTSLDAITRLDHKLLDLLSERVVIFLGSQLLLKFIQLLYFLLDLLHLSFDYLLLSLGIA